MAEAYLRKEELIEVPATIILSASVKQRTPLQAAGHVRAGHQLFEF